MSFTKVAPLGIGTEPGTSIQIGDSLLHSTGIDLGSGTGIGASITRQGNATFTGIVTAASFSGDITGNVTGTATQLATNATGTNLTLSGNLGVGGVLTYEDVTNVDSVGLITARAGINLVGNDLNVGSNIKLGNASGIVTATSFSGDGSNLTGIDSDKISELNTEVETVDTGSDGHVKITTDGAERVRVTDDGTIGKVGINTAAPNGVLAVRNGDIITEINPFPASNKSFIGNRSNHPISLQINAAEVIKINSSGKLIEPHNSTTHFSQHSVGVGTTTTAGRNAGVGTATGTLLFNSQAEELQVYNGNKWISVSNPFEASGGTKSVSSRSGYVVHTFTSPGTFSVSSGFKDIELMVIGGGGGGGEGGGGAGALYFNNSIPVTTGTGNYAVTIGGGGGGGTAQGNPGNASSFTPSYPAAGGGGGGGPSNANGKAGGSGGGGRRDHNTTAARGPASGAPGGSANANSPTAGWGNIGGYGAHPTWCGAGGGGGAGSAGTNGSGGGGGSETGGNGGNGLVMAIAGPSGVYAGGGGGGCEGSGGPTDRGGDPGPGGGGRGAYSTQQPAPRHGTGGTNGTGGGAGGTASTANPGGSSFQGGSGVVIIAYTST